jgi:hypothetical protein
MSSQLSRMKCAELTLLTERRRRQWKRSAVSEFKLYG